MLAAEVLAMVATILTIAQTAGVTLSTEVHTSNQYGGTTRWRVYRPRRRSVGIGRPCRRLPARNGQGMCVCVYVYVYVHVLCACVCVGGVGLVLFRFELAFSSRSELMLAHLFWKSEQYEKLAFLARC
jgi:hypothetical protein